MKTKRILITIAALGVSMRICGGASNLLCNPGFSFLPRGADGRAGGGQSHNVACWNTDAWGDVSVLDPGDVPIGEVSQPVKGVVCLEPGKRLYQFATFPELACKPGDVLSLAVRTAQRGGGKLKVNMTVLGVESADGQWTPVAFGMSDKREFYRHGRGELVVREQREAHATRPVGRVTLDGLVLQTSFKKSRESSSAYTNAVGLRVEFLNESTEGEVWIWAPVLSKSPTAAAEFAPGRPVPEYYRRLPNTIGKLLKGDPIHILALGSSIDTGDANPVLYIYDEDPDSPTYKQPLYKGGFDAKAYGRPDLEGYIGSSRQVVKYTGRLRRELLHKYNIEISDVLLNAMSRGGSSIGEATSGFRDYVDLKDDPGQWNGHVPGRKWEALYPRLFADGVRPAPDLVIFGHGHNERIDKPDGIAVYEGSIRWFQRHFPDVEILFCQYHATRGNATIPPRAKRRELCEAYGIPFIDMVPLLEELTESWCNFFALQPDGGHPQAGAHFIWFKQLEKMFELPGPMKPFLPQERLPKRMNEYTYGWEGEMVTYMAPHPRIRGVECEPPGEPGRHDGSAAAGLSVAMIIDEVAFNVWAGDGTKENLRIRIDGADLPSGSSAGRGTQMAARDVRNSSFAYGRLLLGDRHIVEILGIAPVKVVALDCKIPPARTVFSASHEAWTRSWEMVAEPFDSTWGAPFGEESVVLTPGAHISLEVEATDVAVAYIDEKEAGTLVVTVDDEERLRQPANVPFVDSDGAEHFVENRRGIRDLGMGKHRVVLQAVSAPVRVLDLTAYDRR